MINLDKVLTFSEAAEKWGLADGKTIRKAVERKRFEPYEIKKSGNVWLTTYEAMYRVFGEPKNGSLTVYYYDFFNHENIREGIDQFLQVAQNAIEEGKQVRVVESEKNSTKIIYIIKTKEELAGWKRRFQFYLNDRK